MSDSSMIQHTRSNVLSVDDVSFGIKERVFIMEKDLNCLVPHTKVKRHVHVISVPRIGVKWWSVCITRSTTLIWNKFIPIFVLVQYIDIKRPSIKPLRKSCQERCSFRNHVVEVMKKIVVCTCKCYFCYRLYLYKGFQYLYLV